MTAKQSDKESKGSTVKAQEKYDAFAHITRRDFVNGSLVGFGAALMSARGPAIAARSKHSGLNSVGVFNDPWTGFGGVGDYAISNGNVAGVRMAAHLIRDGFVDELLKKSQAIDEEYDMVIVGGGFSGIGAAYEFYKEFGDSKKCLILENHPVFGGEAKQNEFEVDGYMVYGPQGSNDFGVPDKEDDSLITRIYHDTGMPFEFNFVQKNKASTDVDAPLENYYGAFWDEEKYDTGYFMGSDSATPWVVNPRVDRLARMPWDKKFKAELNRAFDDKEDAYTGEDFDQWLDSMSYKDLLEKELGYSSKVTEYFDPVLAISMGGVGADVYSAYSAKLLEMPGTSIHYKVDPNESAEDVGAFSYPGGNTGIFRHIMKYLIPECITGGKGFEEILYNPIDFNALDRPENPINMRLNSTVIDVRHAEGAESSAYVNVSYSQNGNVKQLRAKTVVCSIGGWIAKRIASDMPDDTRQAYSQFHHSPILTVNVAVRNWRFLDKLGISSGRWFKGFGNFFSIRRPMITGNKTQPFDPDKPTVMTFYVPFNNSGLPVDQQGPAGRAQLLGKSYADYEKEIIDQMTEMFAAYGFRAERDIAGIVLNRWGHAYISPQPGFHFGKDGKPAPREVVKKGYGRIQFGHSELSGYMSHTRALNEGARAARSVMDKI